MSDIDAATPDNDALTEILTTWFLGYVATFSELACCMRSDTSVLLNYFAAPARIVGLAADMVMRTPDAITGFGGLGAEIESLRRDGLEEITAADASVRFLNPRAALIAATWRLRFLTGETEDRRRAHLVVKEPLGWRIVTVVEQTKPS